MSGEPSSSAAGPRREAAAERQEGHSERERSDGAREERRSRSDRRERSRSRSHSRRRDSRSSRRSRSRSRNRDYGLHTEVAPQAVTSAAAAAGAASSSTAAAAAAGARHQQQVLRASRRADDFFSEAVRRELAGEAGWRCSNPICRKGTIHGKKGKPGVQKLGEAAHITANKPGGPRFDAKMSSSERSSAANGIWLCRTCHSTVDGDDNTHTVDQLHQWKQQAREFAKSACQQPQLAHNPSEISPEEEIQELALEDDKSALLKSLFDRKRTLTRSPSGQRALIKTLAEVCVATTFLDDKLCLLKLVSYALQRSEGQWPLVGEEWQHLQLIFRQLMVDGHAGWNNHWSKEDRAKLLKRCAAVIQEDMCKSKLSRSQDTPYYIWGENLYCLGLKLASEDPDDDMAWIFQGWPRPQHD